MPRQDHLFISYASRDRAAAETICAALESRGLTCWMAPRDVKAGEDWGEAILRALTEARAAVVLLSTVADGSPHVRNEVVAATAHRVPLVPVRLEEMEPTGSLRLHLVGRQWLDAFPPPVTAHAEALAASLRVLLRAEEGWAAAPARHAAPVPALPPAPSAVPVPPPAPAPPARRSPFGMAMLGLALGAGLTAGALRLPWEAWLGRLAPDGSDWRQSTAGPVPVPGPGPLPSPAPAPPPGPVVEAVPTPTPTPTPTPVVLPVPAPSPGPRDLALVNASRIDIRAFYLSPVSSTSWGSDLLGVLLLPAGSRVLLRAPESPEGCWVDLRVVYSDGATEERRDQNVCGLDTLSFDGSAAQRPGEAR
jgi:hypothetical protein